MDAGLFAQYVMNGLMLGMMYALVAVGFTLFFGVLDVIKFSHGDVLTVGAFTALAAYAGLHAIGINSSWFELVVMLVLATLCDGVSRHGDRALSRDAFALGTGAQHAAYHTDAWHGPARMRAAVLPAGRQSETFSGASAARFIGSRRVQSATRQCPDAFRRRFW